MKKDENIKRIFSLELKLELVKKIEHKDLGKEWKGKKRDAIAHEGGGFWRRFC